MSKKSHLVALLAAVLAAVALLPGGASAHHRPDHHNGKPSPEPSPEPTPTPVMVNVELRVESVVWRTGIRHELNRCSVVVPEGASGLQVLHAAVAIGCIESYDTLSRGESREDWWNSEPFRVLYCVEDRCNQTVPRLDVPAPWQLAPHLVSFWDTSPVRDLDKAFAVEGAVLEASYYTWLCATVPNGLCV